MAKWCGKIGFEQETRETSPSVYEEVIWERKYYGDLLEYGRTMEPGEGANDDIQLENQLSILADPFAKVNFYQMRYAVIFGRKRKIQRVKVQYPRMILTLGGEWHGNQPDAP